MRIFWLSLSFVWAMAAEPCSHDAREAAEPCSHDADEASEPCRHVADEAAEPCSHVADEAAGPSESSKKRKRLEEEEEEEERPVFRERRLKTEPISRAAFLWFHGMEEQPCSDVKETIVIED